MAFVGPIGTDGPVLEVTGGSPAGDAAARLRARGRSGGSLVDDRSLVEVYMPAPVMVVVGTGLLVAALDAQAGLLGWQAETHDERTDHRVPGARPTRPQ
jgi:hypothetical protein